MKHLLCKYSYMFKHFIIYWQDVKRQATEREKNLIGGVFGAKKLRFEY